MTVGRCNIDSCALQSAAVVGRLDVQGPGTVQDLRKKTGTARGRVDHDADRRGKVRRQIGDERAQRIDPARGGADDHDLPHAHRAPSRMLRIASRCLMSPSSDTDNTETWRHVPRAIVGLGASAGGIAALREFFAHVPSETGIAWVVILHLSPDHDSKLAEIIQTTADVPVTQVREAVDIDPNHVYVVPPN